eukprot:CAMPEP_0198293526 /NCGR_PEP_ID=MMETSP1449-20131203/17524_1 /TAXON_ID=420275 /ORGANISM="Attheya septentrionalis, Strain CCMP2084" /LENGTH=69 /DNA_ID=CAMNT_0043993127 /DNA_START=246 /DNA_END=455 /DNA_ORIENTATION=-
MTRDENDQPDQLAMAPSLVSSVGSSYSMSFDSHDIRSSPSRSTETYLGQHEPNELTSLRDITNTVFRKR